MSKLAGTAFLFLMIGISFVFPTLLKGINNEMSAMRVLVYMIIAVFITLVIKNGWNSEDFKEIDTNWMYIILAALGGKTVQSYTEALKLKNSGAPTATENKTADTSYTLADVREAIKQNFINFKKYGNFITLVPGTTMQDGNKIPCAVFHISDSNSAAFPKTIPYNRLGEEIDIVCTVVTDVNIPTASAGSDSFVANLATRDKPGTIACGMKDANNNAFLLTCSHVYTGGSSENKGGPLSLTNDKAVDSNSVRIGLWSYALWGANLDIALVKPDNADSIPASGLRPDPYVLTDNDVFDNTEVILNGYVSGSKKGYIINYESTAQIQYSDGVREIDHVIIVSDSIAEPFRSISSGGDSGGLVYNGSTNQAVGILVAGNDQFSYIIPMKAIMKQLDMIII
jgi:hypothetical protein